MARKTPKSSLKLVKVAHKRHDYATRSQINSRAAVSFIQAINGTQDHWSHETIRAALVRQSIVTRDDLLDELPRAAISYAVTKGFIYRSAGEDWFRVTLRGKNELNLPVRDANGKAVKFIDGKKFPPSEPAFEELKVVKIEVTPDRAAALIAGISGQETLAAKAQYYRATMNETGWAAVEIARRVFPDDRKAMGKVWDEVIWLVGALTLEAEYADAVFAGRVTQREGGILYTAAAKDRPALFAAMLDGKSYSAVRAMAVQLAA